MEPPYRPFNCITFNCEAVEKRLSAGDRKLLHLHEAELRSLYAGVEKLFAGRFMHGLLINSERDLREGRGGILGSKVSAFQLDGVL